MWADQLDRYFSKADMLLLLLLSLFSRVRHFATPQTVTHQAPLSMGFFRREYWGRLPFPPPGDRISVSCVTCIGRQILYQ